jgi:hypothetical protein
VLKAIRTLRPLICEHRDRQQWGRIQGNYSRINGTRSALDHEAAGDFIDVHIALSITRGMDTQKGWVFGKLMSAPLFASLFLGVQERKARQPTGRINSA